MFTGLASVALVGGVADLLLHRKFESVQARQATRHFRARVAEYLQRYGAWDPERPAQRFREFMDEANAADPPRGAPPFRQGLASRGANSDGPEAWRRGPPGGPGEGPPGGEPRFRFILTDGDYRVLLGAGIYRDGDVLPEDKRDLAVPVVVDGRTLAYVSTEGVLSPGPDDQAYAEAMHHALWYGVAAAAALALLLGVFLGDRLSASLRRLTAAVQAMRDGDLRQRVPVAGGGEVATLAQAFNRMSAKLAEEHESLQASNRTIREQAARLQELSIRDGLTELYNRRHFDECVRLLFDQSKRHGQPLTLVVADIDWFKQINDRHSHATGDSVLRQVAAILRAHVRASDLLARYGGEEFVIALPQTALPMAAALCDRLRAAIEQFGWSQIAPGLRVTMSMGLCADLDAASVQAMLQRADRMLYRAKEEGRNRVCFA